MLGSLHATHTQWLLIFIREKHRTRTFFQKLQQADKLDTVCRLLDQQRSHFPTFWKHEVFKSLSKLITSKSTGYDGIPNKLLKDASDIIARSLVHIFNASIMTGIFPNDLKVAIISPIHKSGCKTQCNNYRPISVLSAVAKILESLISKQLETYLEVNGVITEHQAGFRRQHSTQTSLLKVTNQWYINMDNGCLNGVLFLDLKKTFDCVDHDILLMKMYTYGIQDQALKWFRSYLTGRVQICKVKQTFDIH